MQNLSLLVLFLSLFCSRPRREKIIRIRVVNDLRRRLPRIRRVVLFTFCIFQIERRLCTIQAYAGVYVCLCLYVCMSCMCVYIHVFYREKNP